MEAASCEYRHKFDFLEKSLSNDEGNSIYTPRLSPDSWVAKPVGNTPAISWNMSMRKSNRIEETQPVSSHNQAQPLHHRRLKWLIATQHAIPCFHAVPAVLWGSLEDCHRSQQESANCHFASHLVHVTQCESPRLHVRRWKQAIK